MPCERFALVPLDSSSGALATEDARGSACAFSVALPNMKIHLNKEKLAWN